MQDIATLQDTLADQVVHQRSGLVDISDGSFDSCEVQVGALIIIQVYNTAVPGYLLGHEFIQNSASASVLDKCCQCVKSAKPLQCVGEVFSFVGLLDGNFDAS